MKRQYLLPTRAEEIGNRVFDYFAMPSQSFYSLFLKNKSVALVGGRGTGKTMLLKSMAFEYKVNNTSDYSCWIRESFIGCYIRIDTTIVSNFRGRGIDTDKWAQLFAHYFNLRVIQQVVKTLKIITNAGLVQEDCMNSLIYRYVEIIDGELCSQTLIGVEKSIRQHLDQLIRFINNPDRIECPILLNNGILIFELCNILQETKEFSDKTWFILLDEFENLDQTQQRLVNSLIKANQPPVIFKIALKPGGWWTQQTSSLTESLDALSDFDLIEYQNVFSDSDYVQLVIEAFAKSLSLNGITKKDYLDVRTFLPDLSPEDEALKISAKSKRPSKYIINIVDYINSFTDDINKREYLKSQLIVLDEPLRTRVHLVLLDRGESPETIADERNNNSLRYKEWYNHNRIGTLYLFCNEYATKKTFCGFDTYILLSSKIMRNFVSLFSRAWELSLDEGFTPESPSSFGFACQSKAAYDISRTKVYEIKSYAPLGPMLESFANYLGRIFEKLNKDVRQSQPERNHFGIKGQLSSEGAKFLRAALLHSVLLEVPGTKMRSDVAVRDKDYLLNRIYCPYYNMSFRKKHKLEIDAMELEMLFLGKDDEKRQVTQKILRANLSADNLSDEKKQISLFDTMF